MGVIAMSGNDIFILNNRNITGFAVGKVSELTIPNNLADVKTGKNGNSIFSFINSGLICEFKAILIRGCADDVFFNSLLTQMKNNFSGFPLMFGQYIKKIGDGLGNVTSDTYNMSGGIFSKTTPAQSDTEGTPEQSQVEYMLKFANNPRTISS